MYVGLGVCVYVCPCASMEGVVYVGMCEVEFECRHCVRPFGFGFAFEFDFEFKYIIKACAVSLFLAASFSLRGESEVPVRVRAGHTIIQT